MTIGYLIDTNVISELIKVNPNSKVVKWFKSVSSEELHLSALTIGEIKKGITKLDNIEKKQKISAWLDNELSNWLEDRILSIDKKVANKWGELQGGSQKLYPAIDSLIAATAIFYDLALVTRNIKDFNYPNLYIVNPWNI